MVDPWGSPWAAANEPPKLATPSAPSHGLLCPPPRAFFGGVAGLTSPSPWGDDDSLGGSPGDQADGVAHAPGWNVWGEPPAHSPAPTLKPDATAKASPIACPTSAATSPGLAPMRRRTSSIFRQASPDPWAAEASWNDRPGPSTISTNKQETLQENESEDLDKRLDPNQLVIHVDGPGLGLVETTKGTKDEDAGGAAISQEAGLRVREAQGDADKQADEDSHDAISRPSSTFSLDSDNGPERQDSPVTSIDEESTFASVSRKGTSAEITPELDDKQDTPTEQTEQEPSLPEHEASVEGQSRLESINEDDAPGDFGDFEDAESDPGQSSLSVMSADTNRSTTPKASKHALAAEASSGSSKIEELVGRFGPIKFEVDLERIDKLPGNIPEAVDEEDPGATTELSDRVISDSFSSIEQRKTWYRISRYGSMRKHNSGEEDNYQRATWKTSQLHDETIRVVRRWIEEDSFHGKPTFGGGKRSSGFDWGSTTGPVDLDQVFKRKSSVQSTTSSIAPLRRAPTAPVTSNSNALGIRNAAGGSVSSLALPTEAASPRVSFGWSSNGVESPTIASPRPLSIHTETPTGSRAAAGTAVNRIKSPVPSRMSLQLPPQSRQAMATPGSPIAASPRPLSIHTDTWGGGSRSTTPLAGGAMSPARSPALKRVSLQLPPPSSGQERSGFCSPPMMSPRPMSIHTDTLKASRAATPAAAAAAANRMSLPPPPKSKHQEGTVVENDDDEWGEMVASPRLGVSSSPSNAAAPPKAKPAAMIIDPWSSADFSVFDQPPSSTNPFSPALSSTTSAAAPPCPSPSKPSTSTTSVLNPTPALSFTHSRHTSSSSAKLAPSSSGPKVVLGPVQSSTAQQELQQDELVRDVVAGLPDLSYMLR